MSDKKVSEQLEQMLFGKLGNNWRVNLPVVIRADTLTWFVRLIEEAIEARRKKIENTPTRDIMDSVTIGSFQIDLEKLLADLQVAIYKLKV